MTSNTKRMMVLLLAAFVLLPVGFGIRFTSSSDAGSISEELQASDKGMIKSSTVIGADSLSHYIEGSGSLRERHSVSNTAGARAEVGADICQADWYSYSYDLSPGRGSFWPASIFPQVSASEQLDVLNAGYIRAYARSSNAKGYTADASTTIYDPTGEASLIGYRNSATASKYEATAFQIADGASAPQGYIQADSQAYEAQLRWYSMWFWEDEAKQSARVYHGAVQGYSDLASSSADGATAEQQMESAASQHIRTGSQSKSWTASLFPCRMKTSNANVKTIVEGTLTGYDASAYGYRDYAQADQKGHIDGAFVSTATAGMESQTRNSNYGTEYDFEMQARMDAAGPHASGRLGYYVDNSSPIANRIQGAVDAAESGDSINVATGTYRENLDIQKSLHIRGTGASETIVDGQQSGSVFTIGNQDNTGLYVALKGLGIQGGTGTPAETAPGSIEIRGGGILNHGTVNLSDCIISGNTADYGAGIYNSGQGTANLAGGSLEHNHAHFGGGIFNAGTVNIDNVSPSQGTSISYNTADIGGGIYNQGTINGDSLENLVHDNYPDNIWPQPIDWLPEV